MKHTSVDFEGEKVYLKKDILGVRVIYPPKNEDGTYNWFNLIIGGWGNFLTLIFILLLVFGFFYIYDHDVGEMREVFENPCDYCVGNVGFDIPNTSKDYIFEGDIEFENKER